MVSDYILNFTKPGDTVLDPFMGSGVVVIESLKHDRKAIGMNLNPMACFITENTINKVDLEDFEKTFVQIYEKNYKKFIELYDTKCPKCGVNVPFENSILDHDEFSKVRAFCPTHGKFIKNADAYDHKVLKNPWRLFIS